MAKPGWKEAPWRARHHFSTASLAFLSPLLPVTLAQVDEDIIMRRHREFPEDVYSLIGRFSASLTRWAGADSTQVWLPPLPFTEVVVRDTALWLNGDHVGATGYAQHVVTIGEGGYRSNHETFQEELPRMGYQGFDISLVPQIADMDPTGHVGIEVLSESDLVFTLRDVADPEIKLDIVDPSRWMQTGVAKTL